MKAAGVVFYEGPSVLNGQPIVGIVTNLARRSKNYKTGDMAQAWILHRAMSPDLAIRSGEDKAICGDCQHRSPDGAIGRSCYVTWWQGPTNVWKAYKRGNVYERETAMKAGERLLGRHVRLGAYGDPAAIPYKHWLALMRLAGGWVGYTQQWRTCDPMFARLLMASVQSPSEAHLAQLAGWRTFRVRPAGGMVQPEEVICPASNEAGHVSTCVECQLCRGNTLRAKHVVIEAHGRRLTWFKSTVASVIPLLAGGDNGPG